MAAPKVEKAAPKPRKKVIKKVVIGVDNTPEDVLKYDAEGHQVYFDDGDSFLELEDSVIEKLSIAVKQRYRIAEAIASGQDVLGVATAGTLGYDPKEYNIRAGSATENTTVYGKDPSREYHWGRPDKHNKHVAEGWEVDVDPSVKTRFSESGTQKTLGGEQKREATLYSRPKEVGKAFRAKRKEIRDGRLLKSQNTTKDAAARLGVKVVE